MPHEFAGTGRGTSPALERQLARLDARMNWERTDRAAGARGAVDMRRLDLGPARDLMERLGNPQVAFRAVHVAGTKGKGSVASLVAAGLLRQGAGVGLYTSPHVERIHERIVIDGRPVGNRTLAGGLEQALDACDAATAAASPAASASWFDALTAAAFVAFRDAGCDRAVVECGLGGRLDSTNVIRGAVCVITNVDLEHTAILGDTRAAIAAEKAGILEPGAPVVTGIGPEDAEVGPVLARMAAERGSRVIAVPRDGRGIEEWNLALARAALGAWGSDPELLEPATVAAARLPGRFEVHEVEGVPVALDGAHVPSSVSQALAELQRDPRLAAPPTVVLGMGSDKDADGILKALAGRVDRVLCTSVGTGAYRRAEDLSERAGRLGLATETVAAPRDALETALRRSPRNGWVLVTGSLHLVGALRERVVPREDSTC